MPETRRRDGNCWKRAVPYHRCPLIMDRAYEGDETLQLARELGYLPVVPPNPNRLSRGHSTVFYIAAAMKSNGSFAGSRLTDGCSLASTNWTSFCRLYRLDPHF